MLRVASVPAGHPYVARLGLADAGISVLADPPVPGAPPGRWWPPAMLDPGWITAHASEFDLMHVHFGVEGLSLDRLGEVLSALRDARRPLVHTVHDLTHPQLAVQDHHEAQLAMLVAAADGLITLTPGAARELRRRFGRRATVIAHPAMRDPDAPHDLDPPQGPGPPRDHDTGRDPGGPYAPHAPGAPRDPATPAPIAVHLRDLRPGIDGPGAVATLAAALTGLPGARAEIHLHPRVRDEAAAAAVAAICARSPALRLCREPRPDDDALERQLAGCAASLVPYRHGTHSGWLELCWDLGVPVAIPRIGHLAEQHPGSSTVRSFTPGDADSLRAALRSLLARPESIPGAPARRVARLRRARVRRRRRPGLAAAHRALYDAVR